MNLKFARCLNGICSDADNANFNIADFFPDYVFDLNLVKILNNLFVETLKLVPVARRPHIYEIGFDVDDVGIMSDNPLLEIEEDAEFSNISISLNSEDYSNTVFCTGDEVYYVRCTIFATKEKQKIAMGGLLSFDMWEEMYYGRY